MTVTDIQHDTRGNTAATMSNMARSLVRSSHD